MLHIDLFSGIGGFALAVDEVWPGTEHIFCEIDSYCRALLKKRFKGARIYGDIRSLSSERLVADTTSTGKPKESGQIRPSNGHMLSENGERFWDVPNTKDSDVFILTGGFPCQPFSQAGKRKGTDDNRYLWPEMLRVIRDFKPTWVIAENVRGILTIDQGMVFEQVCLDLEGEGYEVQPFVIPAVAVNAPHRRDRVWFVGRRTHRNSKGTGQPCGIDGQREMQHGRTSPRSSWERNWLEVATELCGVDDGLSAELDGLKLSKSRHRVERLKALGNAIVPQVAVEIMKAIKHSEGGK